MHCDRGLEEGFQPTLPSALSRAERGDTEHANAMKRAPSTCVRVRVGLWLQCATVSMTSVLENIDRVFSNVRRVSDTYMIFF